LSTVSGPEIRDIGLVFLVDTILDPFDNAHEKPPVRRPYSAPRHFRDETTWRPSSSSGNSSLLPAFDVQRRSPVRARSQSPPTTWIYRNARSKPVRAKTRALTARNSSTTAANYKLHPSEATTNQRTQTLRRRSQSSHTLTTSDKKPPFDAMTTTLPVTGYYQRHPLRTKNGPVWLTHYREDSGVASKYYKPPPAMAQPQQVSKSKATRRPRADWRLHTKPSYANRSS